MQSTASKPVSASLVRTALFDELQSVNLNKASVAAQALFQEHAPLISQVADLFTRLGQPDHAFPASLSFYEDASALKTLCEAALKMEKAIDVTEFEERGGIPPRNARINGIDPAPAYFMQNSQLLIRGINVASDLDSMPLLWWTPVTRVTLQAAINPLCEFMRNISSYDLPLRIGYIAHDPTAAELAVDRTVVNR